MNYHAKVIVRKIIYIQSIVWMLLSAVPLFSETDLFPPNIKASHEKACYGFSVETEVQLLDTLIFNGIVYSGSPPKPEHTNIGIIDDTIVYMGTGFPQSRLYINAQEKWVVPGFIDGHTHVDQGFRTDWNPVQYLSQGYTTVLGGNCGTSPLDLPKHIEDIQPLGINYGLFIGHNSLRRWVMRNQRRNPSEKELQYMIKLLKTGMEAGAFGLSTGLAYRPGIYSDASEIIALLQGVAEFDPIYTTHMRYENHRIVEAVEEAIHIASEASCQLNIAHLKCYGSEAAGLSEEVLGLMHEARNQGLTIYGDVYPFHSSGAYLHFLIPSSYRRALRRNHSIDYKALETYLLNEMADRGGVDGIYIAESEDNAAYCGMNLEQIAAARDSTVIEALIYLLQQDYYTPATFAALMEEDMLAYMQDPFVSIISDSSIGFFNHPRATSVTYTIVHDFVLTRGFYTPEQAIYKMATLPAEIYGLQNRGILQTGYKADMVIFAPDALHAEASYTHPEYLTQGIDFVFLNGVLVYAYDEFLGIYAGEFVKKRIEE